MRYSLKIFACDFRKYSIADLRCSNRSMVCCKEMLPNVHKRHLRFDASLAMRNANCLSLVMKAAARLAIHHSKISGSLASAASTSRTDMHLELLRTAAMRGGKLLSRRMSFMAGLKACGHVQHLCRVLYCRRNFFLRQLREGRNDRLYAISRRDVAKDVGNADARTFNAGGTKANITVNCNVFTHGASVAYS